MAYTTRINNSGFMPTLSRLLDIEVYINTI